MSDRLLPEDIESPVRVPAQVGPLLKSLRKVRGVSQAALGRTLGVTQTRIAQIESQPGSVSLEQIMVVLRALDAELVVRARSTTTVLKANEPGPPRGSW